MIGILIGLKEKSILLGSIGPKKSAKIAVFVQGGPSYRVKILLLTLIGRGFWMLLECRGGGAESARKF